MCHVFMCHVKVPTEVNEAGQSPAGLGHPATPLQSGRHQVTSTPSLKQRFSTFTAHWNHLGSSSKPQAAPRKIQPKSLWVGPGHSKSPPMIPKCSRWENHCLQEAFASAGLAEMVSIQGTKTEH